MKISGLRVSETTLYLEGGVLMGLLYTIGHSQHDFEYFSDLLKKHHFTTFLKNK